MIRHYFFRVTVSAIVGAGLLSGCAVSKGSGSATSKDDAQITADVRAALDQHPDLRAPNQVYVDTRRHVVYLTGTVDDGWTSDHAVSVARAVLGVNEVVSDISIDK